MPETNILVRSASGLLALAKALMTQSRAALNARQQDANTQGDANDAANGKQKEGRRRRQRSILRPTAVGGGYPVAIGFINFTDPEYPYRSNFRLTSGDGTAYLDTYADGWDAPTEVNESYFTGPGGVVWVLNYVKVFEEGPGMQYLLLPVGRDVFVHVAYSVSYGAYTQTIGGGLYAESGDPPDGTYYSSVTTTNYDPEIKVFVTCHLVSKSAVKQITPGAGLVDILGQSYPADSVETALSTQAISELNGVPVVPSVSIIDGMFTVNNYRYVYHPDIAASSWGINRYAQLWTGITSEVSTFGSPGVYSVLSENQTIWQDAGEESGYGGIYGYDHARTFLAETGLSPPVFSAPCALDGTCPAGVIGHDQTRSDPADAPGGWVPVGAFTPNRPEGSTSTTFPLTNGQRVMHVWDGGNPGYCRAQLLALGFTEEDLAP